MESPGIKRSTDAPADTVGVARETPVPRGGIRAGALVHTHGPSSTWGVLRHTHFRRVWAASFVSNSGNWMELVGIQMTVATITGELKMLGIHGAATLTPILVFGLFGGLAADRFNRRTLLVVTQGMLMLLAIAVAVASMFRWERPITQVWVLIGLGSLQGLVMAFNMPAWQVMTPRLVPKDELTAAITLNGIQFNLARAVGPALAGLIMGTWGTTPLFWLNAATFLGVMLAVWYTPDAPAPASDGRNPWRQIGYAVAYIVRGRGPLAIFMAMFLMSMLAAPLVRLLSMFVIDVYHLHGDAADKTVGWLLGVQGIGAVIGGLCLRSIPRWYPKHHFIPLAVAACGMAITLFALARDQRLGYAAMGVVGFFWIWAFNQSWAAMQNIVPDAMRGRVMSVANVAAFGATAAGGLAGGYFGELLAGVSLPLVGIVSKAASTQAAIGALSIMLMLAGLVMMIWRVPEVDGLQRGSATWRERLDFINAITARNHRPSFEDDTASPGRVA